MLNAVDNAATKATGPSRLNPHAPNKNVEKNRGVAGFPETSHANYQIAHLARAMQGRPYCA